MELSPAEVEALVAGGFVLRDGFLGRGLSRFVHAMASGFAASGALRPAATGKEASIDRELRGDLMGWLDPGGPGIGRLFEKFEALRLTLDGSLDLGLTRFEVQLACYPGGGARYARHRDAFAGDNQRVATAIYYLNPGWTPAAGGQIRMYAPSGPVDVEPLLDRLLIFLAEKIDHEVLPVHETRLAITAWYRRD